MEVTKIVNLAPLRTIFYRIDPLLPLEEVIIENYTTSSSLEKNTLNKVVQYAINQKFNTVDKVYKFSSLSTFYNTKKFVHMSMIFIDTLNTILYRTFDANVNKIEFNKVVTKDDSTYDVEFKAEYL